MTTRDYKNRGRRKPKSSGPPPWVWLAVGLATGLFIAFIVYLQMRSPSETRPQPAQTRVEPAMQDTRDVRKTRHEPMQPLKSRFDFYDMLPEMEVIVPEREITGKPRQGVKQVEKPGTYLLQVGSFPKLTQADQLRAQLALLGLETSIQTVSVSDKGTWHRVRVGPYKNLSDLNGARTTLKGQGIDPILIAVKPN